MSTKNHNILCFVDVSGTKVLNKGICLWKAPKALAGRGFPPVQICPKSGAVSEPATAPPQNPRLVLAGGGDKTQEWCSWEEICADVEIGGEFWKRDLLLEVRLGWNLLLMEDAHDTNSARSQSVKENVLTLFVPAKPGTDCVAGSTHSRIFREKLKRVFKFTQIPICLLPAPCIGCIGGNQINIGLSFG
jgi:hypothetical protein